MSRACVDAVLTCSAVVLMRPHQAAQLFHRVVHRVGDRAGDVLGHRRLHGEVAVRHLLQLVHQPQNRRLVGLVGLPGLLLQALGFGIAGARPRSRACACRRAAPCDQHRGQQRDREDRREQLTDAGLRARRAGSRSSTAARAAARTREDRQLGLVATPTCCSVSERTWIDVWTSPYTASSCSRDGVAVARRRRCAASRCRTASRVRSRNCCVASLVSAACALAALPRPARSRLAAAASADELRRRRQISRRRRPGPRA